MSLQCQFLAENEKHKIHRESVRILEEVGVKFHSGRALKILKDNGAKVDNDTGIARIPEDMVQQALKTAPKSFILGARLPEYDFPLPSTYSGYVFFPCPVPVPPDRPACFPILLWEMLRHYPDSLFFRWPVPGRRFSLGMHPATRI